MQRLIDINQVRGNFFGGLPYSINWSFNNGEEPSKLSINVVSENGGYQTPNPTFTKTERVQIGSFTFEGFLVGYSFNNTPSQKILELEYVDKAINLDKWYVGLHTKHGDKNKNTTPRLILVGKQYHPCDTNLDSSINYTESNTRQIDYCDPCPFMPEDKYDFACDPVLSNFEIYDVYYTFNELISKIPTEFSIEIQGRERYKNYKAQHVGTLKSVLSSWCADLGLSYYWDPFIAKLVFIDRSKPIKIPQAPTNWQIIDLNEGKNILNTFSRGFIGNFEKAGEIKNYTCTNETIETVRCLTVSDLYEPGKSTGLSNETVPNESDIRELTTAVSYLGISARNVFLWFWYYQINTPQDLIDKYKSTTEEESNKENDLKLKTKILKYLGDMKIRDVYHAKGTPDQVEKFNACQNRMQDADFDRLAAEDKKNGYELGEYSYYFFVAEVNEELTKKQNDSDVELARNFLGKYWFKNFSTRVPGASNSNGEVSVESPDGSASWKRTDEDLKGLPIFNFGHQEKSLIGNLAKEIEKDARENDRLEQLYRAAAKSFTQNNTTLKNLKSFILLERDGKWFPNEDFLQYYDSLFKWFQDVSPQIFSTADGRPEFLFQLHPEAAKNKNIKLFICRELKNGFDVEFSVEPHPLEPKTRKQRTEEEQDVLGNTIVVKKGAWGLRDSKAVKIKFGGDRGITFFCPTQSFGNNKIVKNDTRDKTEEEKVNSFDNQDINLSTDDGSSGYSVYVKSSAEFTKVLPKIQYIYTKNISSLNVAKIDYNLKQITEGNLSLLNSNRCLISKQAFDSYAQRISEFSQYSMQEAQKTMSFKTAGIFPLQYNCSQGLSSVQITIADDGVYTSYSFEDLIVEPPSDDYFNQYLKDSLLPKQSIGYLNSVTKNNVNSIRTAVGYVRN
jgi:hypothetical protein